jgi:hypothetical protein
MAKSNENWLNPTQTLNRFSALQQEEDLVNQPSPGKEATPQNPAHLHHQCHFHPTTIPTP